MAVDLSEVGILTRREIEARIAGPLIKAFMAEFGEEKTMNAVKKVIKTLARESGQQAAQMVGGNDLSHFQEVMVFWGAGGAFDQEVLRLSEANYDFDITRCRYAEMYKELGLADLGLILSCGRDFDMIEGFNPRMRLARTKTLMEGRDRCDFRISLK